MVAKLLSALLLIFISAFNSDSTNIADEDIQSTEIQKYDQQTNQEIIQKILDLPKWQWVYHPEVDGRLPVKLLKNNLVNDTFELNKFSKKVQILPLKEIERSKIKGYVEIKDLKLRGDTIYFKVEYRAEGAFAEGNFIKKNNEWVVDNYTVVEK